jgi:putative hydrolase
LKAASPLQIFSGIETKLLNQAGDLDMPDNVDGVDFVYVADHQFPLGNETFTPAQVKEMLATERVTPAELFAALVEATANSLNRHPRIVIAHLFSILPKIGLSEEQVPENLIAELAAKAYATGRSVGSGRTLEMSFCANGGNLYASRRADSLQHGQSSQRKDRVVQIQLGFV